MKALAAEVLAEFHSRYRNELAAVQKEGFIKKYRMDDLRVRILSLLVPSSLTLTLFFFFLFFFFFVSFLVIIRRIFGKFKGVSQILKNIHRDINKWTQSRVKEEVAHLSSFSFPCKRTFSSS